MLGVSVQLHHDVVRQRSVEAIARTLESDVIDDGANITEGTSLPRIKGDFEGAWRSRRKIDNSGATTVAATISSAITATVSSAISATGKSGVPVASASN